MNTSRSKRRRVPFQTQMSPECYTPKHLPPPGAMGEWEVPSLKCFDNNMHKSTMANREPAMLEEDHQGKALHINGDDSDSSGSASTELSSIFSWRHNEFERAASLRVHGLFDELEEQLFEGKAGNLSDELRKECMQWTDHFPHLRVRGQQLTEKSPDNLKSSPPPSVVSAMTVSPSEPAEQSDTYQWQDSEHVTEGAEAACNSHPDGNLIPDSQTAHIKQQVIDILFDELWQGLLEVRGGLGETLGVFMRALMTEAHGTEFRLEQRSRPHGEQPPMKNLSPQSLCFTDVQSHHSQAIRTARDIQNDLKELVLVQAKPLQQRPRTMRPGWKDMGKFSPPKKPLLLPPINSDSNYPPLPLILMHQNQVHQSSPKEPSTSHDTVDDS
uniref:protein FAM149A-like isoform X1 n=2 Tax=Myxine glutinosa TaxID=7769 RepID=UPI00358FA385